MGFVGNSAKKLVKKGIKNNKRCCLKIFEKDSEL